MTTHWIQALNQGSWTGLLLLAMWTTGGLCIQCLNENGDKVDWFIVYKLPRLRESSHPLVQEGLGHLYLDAKSATWKLGSKSLNDTDHAIAHTLGQIYDNHESDKVAYVMYNDEKPPKVLSMYHGHTKGDLAFSNDGGFWLVHSVPRFPPYSNESYSYPESGTHYGQTFLCISLDYKYFNQIGIQLQYTYPQIYDSNLPQALSKDNPDLANVLQKGLHVKSAPWTHLANLVSKGGQTFQSFAKYKNFSADIYSVWLAPLFKTDLYVESWQNGVGKLTSNCTSQYKVYNIQLMSPSALDVSFKETQDHSKWTAAVNNTWTCVGGINRAVEQEQRAGGTVCFNIPSVWKSFSQSIEDIEPCPKSASLKTSTDENALNSIPLETRDKYWKL